MNLSYGSRGDEVKRLQTALNAQGYGLSVDGVYGAKTQAAVRDYQSKNSLAVDGVAGPLTQGKLYGASVGTSAPASSILGVSAETAAGPRRTRPFFRNRRVDSPVPKTEPHLLVAVAAWGGSPASR